MKFGSWQHGSPLDSRDEFRLAGTRWHLDARTPRAACVVSHAHADHLGRHRVTIATPATCDILRHRLGPEGEAGLFDGDAPGELIALDYGKVHQDGDVAIDLLPAGHVLGSAMVRARTPAGTILYTGDFRLLGDALTVPPCCPPTDPPDVLLMECTYGARRYRFPKRGQVVDQLCTLVAGALAEGRQPVCLCYSLGKAQEVGRILIENGFAVMMHEAAYAITEIYGRHGMKVGAVEKYDPARLAGKVFIAPPHLRRARCVTSLSRSAIFVCTGWAMDSGARFRYQADHAIPLSDHADFDELVEFVGKVRPRKVLLTHGFVDEMVGELRARAFDAHPAMMPAQGRLFEP